jgi:hypothetical protein
MQATSGRIALVVSLTIGIAFALTVSTCPLWAQTLTVQIVQPDDDPFTVAVGVAQPFEAVACVDGVELDDGTVTWNWDFGDGSDPSTDNPTAHTYADDGNFTVTVTATYNGLQAQASISAAASPAGIEADLEILPAPGTVCDTVTVKVRIPCQTLADNSRNFTGARFYKKVNGVWVQQGGVNDEWSPTAWEMDDNGKTYWAGSYVWQTAAEHNESIDWRIDYRVDSESLLPPATRPPIIGSREVTWTPCNTVVTSGTDVILHHAGNNQHQINWNIVHMDVPGLTFNVTVTIYDMSGGTVKTLNPPAQSGPGSGSVTWDGTDNFGGQVPAGVYAYTVAAGHGSGANSCGDMDKSMAPTMTIASRQDQPFTYNLDVPSLTVDMLTPWEVDGAASGCTITVYGPRLDAPKATANLGDIASNPTTGYNDLSFGIAPTEVGTFTAVLSAMQTPAVGAANRDGKAKPILQKGNALQIWPQAFVTGWGVDDVASVIDSMGMLDSLTGTHYQAGGDDVHTMQGTTEAMKSSSIIFLAGHGAPWDIGPQSEGGPDLSSQQGNDDPTIDLYHIQKLPFQLNRAQLIYFAGCNTWNLPDAPTGFPADGGLISASLAKGGHAAAGYVGITQLPMRMFFDARLFQYMMHDDDDVGTAAEHALDDTLTIWGISGNAEGFRCTNYRLTLKSARWGE